MHSKLHFVNNVIFLVKMLWLQGFQPGHKFKRKFQSFTGSWVHTVTDLNCWNIDLLAYLVEEFQSLSSWAKVSAKLCQIMYVSFILPHKSIESEMTLSAYDHVCFWLWPNFKQWYLSNIRLQPHEDYLFCSCIQLWPKVKLSDSIYH